MATARTPLAVPRITLAEFEQMPERFGPYELIDGRIVEKPVPNFEHGDIAHIISMAVRDFDRKQKFGLMRPEVAVYLTDDYSPVPDLSYWKAERAPNRTMVTAPRPDLAVEVHSPGQTVKDMTDKAVAYINGGVPIVWVIYPKRKITHVFRQGQRGHEIVRIDGVLDGEGVIPGFQLTMQSLFE
jgi:Uma2 family endonuclease